MPYSDPWGPFNESLANFRNALTLGYNVREHKEKKALEAEERKRLEGERERERREQEAANAYQASFRNALVGNMPNDELLRRYPDLAPSWVKAVETTKGKGYTLSPGAARFDASNNKVASVPGEAKGTFSYKERDYQLPDGGLQKQFSNDAGRTWQNFGAVKMPNATGSGGAGETRSGRRTLVNDAHRMIDDYAASYVKTRIPGIELTGVPGLDGKIVYDTRSLEADLRLKSPETWKALQKTKRRAEQLLNENPGMMATEAAQTAVSEAFASLQKQSTEAFMDGNDVVLNGQKYRVNADGTVTIDGKRYKVER
jgi:hypothetical protein